MRQLDGKNRQAQMDDMRSFDGQMPCVGIFWYNTEDQSFLEYARKN